MKQKNFKMDTLLEVIWADIIEDSGWLKLSEAKDHNACDCKSVGYFLNGDKKVLRMSSSIQFSHNNERSVTVIPWGCIEKIRRLK